MKKKKGVLLDVEGEGEHQICFMWADNFRINGELGQGIKYKETIGKIQRILHSWWKTGVAKPISNIDSFVNHVYTMSTGNMITKQTIGLI